MAYSRTRGVDAGIMRIFNTFGPRMRPQDGRVVSSFITQALHGDPLTVYGDGSQTRSFCYVDDMTRGIIAMIDSHETGPVNLGNPVERTVIDLAGMVLQVTGSASPVEFCPLPVDDPRRRRPDICRAQSRLGWHPVVDMAEGIGRTIAWFRSCQERLRITVIGTGYLGAVHAAGMAELGHAVLGIDVDAEKIELLAAGWPPFFEPGLPELLRRNVEAGRLKFSTSLGEAADFGDVHFICVGTPQRNGLDAADLTALETVVGGLAPHLKRACLVVVKSTVPVGTVARLGTVLADVAPAGDKVHIASNPEFLREGFAVQDTLRPDRIVIGVTSPEDAAVLQRVYASILAEGTPRVCTDLATAELVKVSANSFLATKISFINAVAEVCDMTGADVIALAKALGLDPRIGRQFLSPGLGFGGGCLGKDIRAFCARMDELGAPNIVTLLRDVDKINLDQRQRAVALASEMLGGSVSGKRIGILGATFKPNTDDVRDSPALVVAAALQLQGAQVRVHDPAGIDNARKLVPALDYTTNVSKVFEHADLILHLTEWPEYLELDPAELAPLTSGPRFVEARNSLDLDRWRNAGWEVRAMGRANHRAASAPAPAYRT